jgi:succinate dehydrogenase / fumarate reductase membrane anchor subunit
MQRATAVVLLLCLGAHLWVLHFALVDEGINFSNVTARLQTPFFLILDCVLLAVVLFHALNGLRAVLLDFSLFQRLESALTWALFIVGVVTLFFGASNLLPFISGQPRY